MKSNHAIVIRTKKLLINNTIRFFLKNGKRLSTSNFDDAHYFNSNAEALTFMVNQPEPFRLNNEVAKVYF